MKTVIVTAAIVLLTSTANAAIYRGSFESQWSVHTYTRPVTVEFEATSDGTTFQIDTMGFQFTDTIESTPFSPRPGSFGPYWPDTSLDPVFVTVDMFTAQQPLNFIPGSSIATITPLRFEIDSRYVGILREGTAPNIRTTLFDNDHWPNQLDQINTLFDFGIPGEITMTFMSARDFTLAPIGLSSTPGNATLELTTVPIVLLAVPEPTTCGLVIAGALFIAIGKRRAW